MGKRVTGNYYIPSLSKGLVDNSTKGRIDESYKGKSSELTNFWIKNNNNIAKRPPVRPVAGLEGLKHIIDVTETEDRIVFLRQVDLNIPTQDDEGNPIRQSILQFRRRQLLEEIGWRTGDGVQVGDPGNEHIDFISPDDPVDFQLWHYGTSPHSVARDDIPGPVSDDDRTLYPEVTVLDSYDRETHDHKLDERVYFVRWNFTNNTRARNWVFPQGTDKNFTSEVNRAYGDLEDLNLTSLTRPASAGAARTVWENQADILKEYTSLLGKAPTHTFIINKGEVIATSTVHGVPHHPVYPNYIKEIPLEDVSKAALDQLVLFHPGDDEARGTRIIPQENLFQNTDLPTRLFTNHFGKVELYAFGLDYIWDRDSLVPALRSSEEMNESRMRNFVTKPTSISVRELEVRAGIYPITASVETTDSAALGTTRFLNDARGANMTIEELIQEIPDMYHIYDFLRFSLCNFTSLSTTHTTYGRLNYIVPDIQIPVQGTDIPAYGQFLFKVNYRGETYNAFVTHFNYNSFYSADPTRRAATPFWLEAPEDQRENYPNGLGSGDGDFGVYIALQKDNELIPVLDGRPTTLFFNEMLTKYDDGSTQPDTDFVIYLSLDLLGRRVREVMDDLKLVSFYRSNNYSMSAPGMVQLSSYIRDRNDDGDIDPARTCPVGNYIKINSTTLHLIPWANPDMYNVFWQYASSADLAVNPPTPVSLAADGSVVTEAGTNQSPAIFRSLVTDSTYFKTPAAREDLVGARNNDIPTELVIPGSSNQAQIEVAQGFITALARGSIEYNRLYSQLFYNRTGSAGSYGINYIAGPNITVALQLPASATTTDFVAGNISLREYMDYLIGRGFTQTGVKVPPSVDSYSHSGRTGSGAVSVIYFERDDIDVTSTSTTDTSVSEEVNVTRDNIAGLRETYQQRYNSLLAAATTDTHFYPESIFFASYFENTASVPFSANDRVARAVDNILAFSNVQNIVSEFQPAQFSTGFQLFLRENIAHGREPDYLRRSDLGAGVSIFNRTRSPIGPQTRPLFNKDLTPVSIHDYIETSRGGLVLTDKRVYSATGFGLDSSIAINVIHETGFTGGALSDDTFVIGPEGDKVKAIRYYEEAGGYITDIVNAELELPGRVIQGVSLANKHKVIIFRTENDPNGLFTMSINNQRGIKGFTRFEVPCSISYLTKLDEDRIGIVTEECEYLEMDFSKDYNNEEGKWQDSHIVDQQGNPVYQPYECAVTPLPILQVYSDDFSLLKSVTIRYLIAGVNGHPAFKVEIIDGQTGKRAVDTDYRRVTPGMVTVDQQFAGQVIVKSIPRNGSSAPEIRVSKTDDEYIEFSSFNIQLGG